jgi:exosortase/archaeosortase
MDGRGSERGGLESRATVDRFGFTVAWVVYLVFWLLLAREWVSVEAAFPAMGAFTGGSYCLFMGITGLRGWYETRNAPD